MSHQTGIKANAELIKFFSQYKDGKTRALKICIEDEELALMSHESTTKNDWEEDFDRVMAILRQPEPYYLLYRLDETSSTGGYFWLLFSFVPDSASVRQKMLYASTKATLKAEFGSANIKEDIHATQQEELTLEGYSRHKRAFSAPAPLTTREQELKELRKTTHKADFSVDSRQTISGLTFPVSEAASAALQDFARGSYSYLQFRIEMDEEKIHLVKAMPRLKVDNLPAEVPDGEARYHLFLFGHTHEGDFLESVVFIYSMPGSSCPVKERMVYSSCKAPFLELVLAAGIEVAKNVEIDSGKELSEGFLQDELHPKKHLPRPAFAKPKPPNRGPKRLILPQDD